MKLTSRQEKMLSFIRDFLEDNGYPPSMRQIGEAVGISSTSVVSYNLNALETKGVLERGKEVARGLRLSGSTRARQIPILGTIAAGEPLLIPDDSFSTFSVSDQETISLTKDIVPKGEGIYALRVKGDSMIDALVHDGDIVVLRHQEQAESGDMVAAWIVDRQETTLKRFYPEKAKKRVELRPANPNMSSIYVDADNLEIRGKVMVVIRKVE